MKKEILRILKKYLLSISFMLMSLSIAICKTAANEIHVKVAYILPPSPLRPSGLAISRKVELSYRCSVGDAFKEITHIENGEAEEISENSSNEGHYLPRDVFLHMYNPEANELILISPDTPLEQINNGKPYVVIYAIQKKVYEKNFETKKHVLEQAARIEGQCAEEYANPLRPHCSIPINIMLVFWTSEEKRTLWRTISLNKTVNDLLTIATNGSFFSGISGNCDVICNAQVLNGDATLDFYNIQQNSTFIVINKILNNKSFVPRMTMISRENDEFQKIVIQALDKKNELLRLGDLHQIRMESKPRNFSRIKKQQSEIKTDRTPLFPIRTVVTQTREDAPSADPLPTLWNPNFPS